MGEGCLAAGYGVHCAGGDTAAKNRVAAKNTMHTAGSLVDAPRGRGLAGTGTRAAAIAACQRGWRASPQTPATRSRPAAAAPACCRGRPLPPHRRRHSCKTPRAAAAAAWSPRLRSWPRAPHPTRCPSSAPTGCSPPARQRTCEKKPRPTRGAGVTQVPSGEGDSARFLAKQQASLPPATDAPRVPDAQRPGLLDEQLHGPPAPCGAAAGAGHPRRPRPSA